MKYDQKKDKTVKFLTFPDKNHSKMIKEVMNMHDMHQIPTMALLSPMFRLLITIVNWQSPKKRILSIYLEIFCIRLEWCNKFNHIKTWRHRGVCLTSAAIPKSLSLSRWVLYSDYAQWGKKEWEVYTYIYIMLATGRRETLHTVHRGGRPERQRQMTHPRARNSEKRAVQIRGRKTEVSRTGARLHDLQI